MIRAIIFDCFGVLMTEGWLPFADEHFGQDTALRSQATDLMVAVNKGFLDYDEFVQKVAELAHVSVGSTQNAIMRNAPNVKLFAYIRNELKPRYKIGLLSNTGRDRLRELFKPEQLALFDVLSLSYETGFLKPDPRAYEEAAESLDVEAGECVFVDDQDARCIGARNIGMHTVCYQNFQQMKHELEQLIK